MKRVGWLLIVALAWAGAGCRREESIPIAVMTKLQSGSLVGTSEINAARMFLADHNIRSIRIVPIDDGWDPQRVKAAYDEVRKQGIRLLITSHVSTCAVVIRDEINRDRVLTFAAGATTDQLSRRDDYIFRPIQDVQSEQESIADFLNRLPPQSLLIVRDVDNPGYTEPALAHFRRNVRKADVRLIDIHMDRLDLPALEKQMRERDFTILYLIIGGYKSASGGIAQLASRIHPGLTVVYTPWMKTPAMLETAGDTIARSIFPSHYPPRPQSAAIDRYIRTFQERYKYAPTFISINVYTSLQILSQAIDRGYRDSEAIRAWLLRQRTFTTDFGVVRLDEYGDTRQPLYFITDLRKEF